MILIVTYNTQQEKLRAKISFAKLFLFSWIGALLAFIPGFDQAGQLNSEIFLSTWAAFLPFTNLGMNINVASYLYMNKYDSSFNMLTSNISAVLVLWTGWVPAMMENTVGFVPSVPLTTLAMIASVLAIYPSYKYSLHMRAIKEEEAVGLIQKP